MSIVADGLRANLEKLASQLKQVERGQRHASAEQLRKRIARTKRQLSRLDGAVSEQGEAPPPGEADC